MKISYNWLGDYLPLKIPKEELSEILTGIGLEVESLEKSETVRGSLQGLVIGEVLAVEAHPKADKLKITRVHTGNSQFLSIICGAPNVSPGQKVVVAPVGSTLYPLNGDPVVLKLARIRGEESQGMICAEDEIGLGPGHEGILVLDASAVPGNHAQDYFQIKEDYLFEIGLTPNRPDAMSHLGVARDICTYLNHQRNGDFRVRIPEVDPFPQPSRPSPVSLVIENQTACPRYAGIVLDGVRVMASPAWIQDRLKAIGIRPVNIVVDITNFVLHECGQPLHAFDRDEIQGAVVRVKNLPDGTSFVTLDGKERKLDGRDLMICNDREGMCLAGIFGGAASGIKSSTSSVFLESAFFESSGIRRSSLHHGLRTEAALRFEKGVDIDNIPFALKRAALLLRDLANARIDYRWVDSYPHPMVRPKISISYTYIRKISGKSFEPVVLLPLLQDLGFSILHSDMEGMVVEVPGSKPDITLPADVLEEIMRIDGLDQIPIPSTMQISPSPQPRPDKRSFREAVANYLASSGFREINTNSITNSLYYPHFPEEKIIRLLNNLSTELDVLRPSMLETGLESIAYNLNRRNEDLHFFEFGKIYERNNGEFRETEQLCLYLAGNKQPGSWMSIPHTVDIYFLKGYLENIFTILGLNPPQFQMVNAPGLEPALQVYFGKEPLGLAGNVSNETLKLFDIKSPVLFARLDWETLLGFGIQATIRFQEIPRFPFIRRDLALILDRKTSFAEVQKTARAAKLGWLRQVRLFDVFENEKLGPNKKSYAVSFIFQDMEKTLTDKEIDTAMERLKKFFINNLKAEIRK